MATIDSSLKNMLLTLLIITAISGTSLGFVYKMTKEPIAAAKAKKQQEAIKLVVPEFTNNPAEDVVEVTSKDEGFPIKIFPARKDDKLVGVAVETMTNKGFGGDVKLMVGFKPDGTIINYQVLEHKETPGLGTKMDLWFMTDKGNQSVIGKNPATNKLTVSKDGGEVDAITAATISSRAFLDAVRVGYETFMDNKDKIEKGAAQ
jgi:electron transport complex protein RnfG